MEQRLADPDLDRLLQDLSRMGSLVETMIADAMKSLLERDSELASGVVIADAGIDRLEKEIDEACFNFFARYQPTAVDLRLLVAVMKINRDLERMGDCAVNIAQGVEILNREPQLKPYLDLPLMGSAALEMVRRSLDAFTSRDTRLAQAVCDSDDEIDAQYERLFREMLDFMVRDPRSVSRALQILLIARNFERIGDHATNIAEDVIYYVEGRDIRHSVHSEKTAR